MKKPMTFPRRFAFVLAVVLTAFFAMPGYGQDVVVKPPSPAKKTEVKKNVTKKKTTKTKAETKKTNTKNKPKKDSSKDVKPEKPKAPSDAGKKPVATKHTANQPYVDLGLSVKWATCNLGASRPEDCGGYYSWGETAAKTEYYWWTYKLANEQKQVFDKTSNLTKYCSKKKYGYKSFVDYKTTLAATDDAATVKLGKPWRMPTETELQELLRKCKWTHETIGAVSGMRVTGPNGNSIFLPAAGAKHGSSLGNLYSDGNYWTATIDADKSYLAHCLTFYSNGGHYNFSLQRCHGFSIRPVHP